MTLPAARNITTQQQPRTPNKNTAPSERLFPSHVPSLSWLSCSYSLFLMIHPTPLLPPRMCYVSDQWQNQVSLQRDMSCHTLWADGLVTHLLCPPWMDSYAFSPPPSASLIWSVSHHYSVNYFRVLRVFFFFFFVLICTCACHFSLTPQRYQSQYVLDWSCPTLRDIKEWLTWTGCIWILIFLYHSGSLSSLRLLYNIH